ncbi:hypothetical protein AAG570_006493 [Ranatra chinensis]|uniref:Uncharacterized protein n=1 Tax=Ranatra chinensis TaxID=642074 RepID=A0ABD0YUH2_9HEMI
MASTRGNMLGRNSRRRRQEVYLPWSVVSWSEFVGPNRFRLIAVFRGLGRISVVTEQGTTDPAIVAFGHGNLTREQLPVYSEVLKHHYARIYEKDEPVSLIDKWELCRDVVLQSPPYENVITNHDKS